MALAWLPQVATARHPRWSITRWGVLLLQVASRQGDGPAREIFPSADEPSKVFEPFFRRHEREIFGYLWRLTSDEQAAHDLSQETFVRAWQRFAKISAYEQPRAWLFRVATNLALNYRRGRATPIRSTMELNEEAHPVGGDPAPRLAQDDLVHRALGALPPRQRAALVLREVYGFSCEEVAAALDTSLGAAKTMLWRGREQFRVRYLNEEEQL